MSYRYTDWPYMIHNNPNEARDTLFKAFRVSGGNNGEAAKLLQIDRSTYYDLMKKLGVTTSDLIIRLAKWNWQHGKKE